MSENEDDKFPHFSDCLKKVVVFRDDHIDLELYNKFDQELYNKTVQPDWIDTVNTSRSVTRTWSISMLSQEVNQQLADAMLRSAEELAKKSGAVLKIAPIRDDKDQQNSVDQQVATTARKPSRIYKPLGCGLNSVLRFVLPKKLAERVVEQMILDAREEHHEALAQGHNRHARWISIRLYLMVAMALVTKLATLPFEKFTQYLQKE